MATTERPWVEPQEVRDWTDRAIVKNRTDAKLKVDITRAEAWIIDYTNNRFDGTLVILQELPEPVRIATILLAEHFAAKAANLAKTDGAFKSERFDDYSYTVADENAQIDSLQLGKFLDEFIITDTGTMTMRMRKL